MQKKLDIIANEVLIEANEWGGLLSAMASEEMDGIYVVPNHHRPHSTLGYMPPAKFAAQYCQRAGNIEQTPDSVTILSDSSSMRS